MAGCIDMKTAAACLTLLTLGTSAGHAAKAVQPSSIPRIDFTDPLSVNNSGTVAGFYQYNKQESSVNLASCAPPMERLRPFKPPGAIITCRIASIARAMSRLLF